jgi:hypothetical protein
VSGQLQTPAALPLPPSKVPPVPLKHGVLCVLDPVLAFRRRDKCLSRAGNRTTISRVSSPQPGPLSKTDVEISEVSLTTRHF